jgi:hypothetical protein
MNNPFVTLVWRDMTMFIARMPLLIEQCKNILPDEPKAVAIGTAILNSSAQNNTD